MENEIITVTPEIAKEWLKKTKVNRKLRPNYVEYLCNGYRSVLGYRRE